MHHFALSLERRSECRTKRVFWILLALMSVWRISVIYYGSTYVRVCMQQNLNFFIQISSITHRRCFGVLIFQSLLLLLESPLLIPVAFVGLWSYTWFSCNLCLLRCIFIFNTASQLFHMPSERDIYYLTVWMFYLHLFLPSKVPFVLLFSTFNVANLILCPFYFLWECATMYITIRWLFFSAIIISHIYVSEVLGVKGWMGKYSFRIYKSLYYRWRGQKYFVLKRAADGFEILMASKEVLAMAEMNG